MTPLFLQKMKVLFVFYFLLSFAGYAQEMIEKTDANTNEKFNYQKIVKKQDGILISDADVDGVLLWKQNSSYYKRVYQGHINIKWFGAIGDGKTDDTKAIQKAINAIYNLNKPVNISGGWLLGSGVVYFPSGDYKISDKIIIKDNISLLGENKNTVRINSSVPIAFTNIEGETAYPKKMNHSINIENLFLTGGGIELQGAYRTSLRNVNIFNVASGIGLIARMTVAFYMDEVQIFNCKTGIFIQGTAGKGPSTTIDINRLWVTHCSSVGMSVSSAPNELISSKIRNSIFEYNDKGVVLSGKNDISFDNIHFEQNKGGALEAYDSTSLNLEDVWCDVGNVTLFAGKGTEDNTVSLKNISAPIYVQNGYKGTIYVDGKVNLQPLPNNGEKVYFAKGNINNESIAKINKGKSNDRPIGIEIDLDLSKPIYWNGSKWVDSTGNSVK
jgi:hypothetical protein